MVPLPGVKHGLVGVFGNRYSLMEGGVSGMCLSGGIIVECFQVNCSSWLDIFLGTDHHTRAPGYWFPHWDRLQNTQPDVSVKLLFDF